MEMPLIGFTVFKEKILSEEKTQTIRKPRKHPIKVGDKLYLYWHTRQKDCEKLGETICTETFPILIYQNYWFNKQRLFISEHNGKQFIPTETNRFKEIVQRDGFKDADEMLKFFVSHYPLPEIFQVIRWKEIYTKSIVK
jgi:hypothetical protein